MKLFYFHIPKTAGTTLNQFFASKFTNTLTHIESQRQLSKSFCNHFDFLSGHLSFDYMDELLDLQEWITFATFRDPFKHTISHMKWIRRLADEGQEARLAEMPLVYQRVALKMKTVDFSDANQIEDFLDWLRLVHFQYFHNLQSFYMQRTEQQRDLNDEQVETVLNHLSQIDYVGVQDKLDDFTQIICREFGWRYQPQARINRNDNDYGFNLDDADTREALLPLFSKDLLLYQQAENQFNQLMAQYQNDASDYWGSADTVTNNELSGWVRYHNSLKKPTIEVRINGHHYAYASAENYRPDLKTNQVHPTGRCGFSVKVPNGTTLADCEVMIPGTDYHLPKTGES